MPRALRIESPGAIYHVMKDARKVQMARRLRAETTVTLKWIAEQLHMGTWTPVANLLAHHAASSDNQPDLHLCQK